MQADSANPSPQQTYIDPALSRTGTRRKATSPAYETGLLPLASATVTAAACDVSVACRILAARSRAVGDLPSTVSTCCAATAPSTASRMVMASWRGGTSLIDQLPSVCRANAVRGMTPLVLPVEHKAPFVSE